MKSYKNSFYLLLCLGLLCASISGRSQTQFIIQGHLVQSDTTRIVLQNAQFINHGTYFSALGTVVIMGDGSDEQSAIGGDSLSSFYNLQINKTANGAQLLQNIQVDNKLQMSSGTLDLNGDTLTLGTSNGTIVGESETSRILGPSGGLIQKTVSLNAPSAENPGNLGLSITSSQDLGSTLIQRSHIAQSLDDTLSITRSFCVVPTNNADLNATIQLHYLDAELNGHDEASLGTWRQDSSFWYNPTSTLDASNNYVQVDGIDFFSEWTLASNAPQVQLTVLLAGAYDDSAGEMADNLRSADVLPTMEPYAGLGYDHPASGGDEVVNPAVFTTAGSDAIVDWVFVELRDSADISNVIAARSALLQKDGDVVDLDGRSNLSFPEITTTQRPLISIRHRNHIGIIAASTVDLSGGPAVLNFSTSPTLTEGGAAALSNLGNGLYGLISGDFDGDGQVQNTDSNALNQNLGSAGYLSGDTDLNGQVQNTDLQIKLTPNLGRGAQFAY